MVISIDDHGNFIDGVIGALATIPSIILVVAASTLPEGLERGQFVVHGCAINLAVLATALVLRVAYVWRYSNALKIVAPEPNYSGIA